MTANHHENLENRSNERSTIFDSPSLLGSAEKSNEKKSTNKEKNLSAFEKLFQKAKAYFNSLNSTKRLIIMVAAAIVIVGAVLLAALLPSSGNSSEHEHEHLTSNSDSQNIINSDQLLLIDRESDELDYLVLENGEGKFTIVKDTEKGALVIKELEGLLQNEDFIEYLWYDALSLGYSYQLAPAAVGELSLYGLDKPCAVVSYHFSDGSTAKFSLGDMISGTEGDYYFTVEGVDGVFVNIFDEAYLMGSRYWLSDDVFGYETLGIPEIGSIKVDVRGGESFVISPHSAKDMSDPFYGKDYIITEPYRCGIYDYYMSSLIEELSCFVAYEAVCPFPTDSDIRKYGMDKPDITLSHQRDGVRHTLRITKANYDYFYCMIDGIDAIYQFDAYSYPILSQLSLELLRSSEVHVRRFEAVERFCVSIGGEEYEFTVGRTPYAGDSSVFEYTVYLNGAEIDTTSYKKVLEAFNTATATSFGGKIKDDEPYMTIEIDYFDTFSAQDEKIEYLPCGNRRYICRINGEGEAILSQLWADEFIALIESINK